MKKLLFFLLFVFSFNTFFAVQTGLETRQVNGKSYQVYKVEKGDTWYAVARKFQISYAELRVANKEADDKLITGKELLIPAKLKPTDPYFQKNIPDKKTEVKKEQKFHTVQPSQTLYSISKQYGITVDQLKEWNGLKSNEISVGQKLIVAKETPVQPEPEKNVTVISTAPVKEPEPVKPVQPSPAETPKESVNVPSAADPGKIQSKTAAEEDKNKIDTSQVTSNVENVVAPPAETRIEEKPLPAVNGKGDDVIFSNGRQQVNETGTASLIEEEEGNADKYFALHRTARIGTVIRVMNLSNSRKIYVRVTGHMQDDSANEGILIKLSKASADKLGMTEKTARVNLLYGTSDE